MKEKIIALLIGVLTVMPVVALAKGPYNSLDHRQDGVDSVGTTKHVLANWLSHPQGDALEIKNKNGEIFVQWWRGVHCVCQCTEGMNLNAKASKLSDGWLLWSPGTSDPRYGWCGSHEFVCLPYAPHLL